MNKKKGNVCYKNKLRKGKYTCAECAQDFSETRASWDPCTPLNASLRDLFQNRSQNCALDYFAYFSHFSILIGTRLKHYANMANGLIKGVGNSRSKDSTEIHC